MQDGTNDPAAAPVPSSEQPGPAAKRDGMIDEIIKARRQALSKQPRPPARSRAALWLAIGGAAGLALGVLLTFSVTATYTFFTQTLPSTRDSAQVFNQLNELRQEINQLNEEKQLKEQEKEDAIRQALKAVASAVPAPESGKPSADLPAKKEGGEMDARPVPKRQDGFAEIDEEIERLQQTQKVLNTILDMFSRKGKERAKDR